MNKTSKPIGRPTFRIDGKRLRALRKEAGLTQLELAKRVYVRACREKSTSADVMKNSAQRWETTGAVPPDMAQHLATELKTSVAILQGALPEPAPSRIDEIESHLKKLMANGPSPELADAIKYYTDNEATNPAREVAEDISSRIEFAQLSQAHDEFKEIAAITGFSDKELWEPQSFLGFWMLIGTGPMGPERSEILSGILSVMRVLRSEMEDFFAKVQESDASVSLSEERHWFQVSMHHPRIRQLTRVLRFVRCQPMENGLQWSSPTWRDRFMLETMAGDAYQFSNFVTNFDGVMAPADCMNLRFALTKAPDTAEQFEAVCLGAKPEVAFLTSGHLEQLHPKTRESFQREGNLHYLVVNRLAADLWDKLRPLLEEWPLECWSFKLGQSCVDVLLNVPPRLYTRRQIPLKFGRRYSVTLVEMTAENEPKTVPWRDKSVSEIHAKLTKSLIEARQEQLESPLQSPTA